MINDDTNDDACIMPLITIAEEEAGTSIKVLY
jgi:hypothetical protein